MYEFLKKLVLKFLKVPPEPLDPMGDVESLRVFRASYNYFRYRFYLWLIKTFVGIIIMLVICGAAFGGIFASLSKLHVTVAVVLGCLAVAAILIYTLAQTYLSYMVLRLDYELRWYKISDRSLRIREGVFRVKELTMTFANIQNLSISQGPIQRFFGIADLRVETAGGGGNAAIQNQQVEMVNMHVAYFRGVDNAEEISELMRKRLKVLRDSGLGHNEESETAAEEISRETGQFGFSREFLGLLMEMKNEAGKFRAAAENL